MGNNNSGRKSRFTVYMNEFYRKMFKSDFMKLIVAIKKGNLDKVKEYHRKKFNFNQYLENGDTPLHVATANNHFEIVQYICDEIQKINIDDKNFFGDTALFLACMNGDEKIIEYLIDKGATVNVKENRGFTPFMAVCANGHIKIAKLMIEKTDANFKARNLDGQTALHRAAYFGELEIIKFLVRSLVMSVWISDKKGNLPIHCASMKTNLSCVRFLFFVSGSDTNERKKVLKFKNKDGNTALDLLYKMMNKLREVNEPEYTIDEIENYIIDKRNVPHKKGQYINLLLSPKNSPKNRHSLLFASSDSNVIRLERANESLSPESEGFISKLLPQKRKELGQNLSKWSTLNNLESPGGQAKISEKSDDHTNRGDHEALGKGESARNDLSPISSNPNREAALSSIKRSGLNMSQIKRTSTMQVQEFAESASLAQDRLNGRSPISHQRTRKESLSSPKTRKSSNVSEHKFSFKQQTSRVSSFADEVKKADEASSNPQVTTPSPLFSRVPTIDLKGKSRSRSKSKFFNEKKDVMLQD